MFLKYLREDIKTVYVKDPAARGFLEVLLCYPGLHAIWAHRLTGCLWHYRLYFIARFLSHIARLLTGVEIHPGAKIGRRFFIDHGAGVVIGETAEIGDDVLMYQGAVLGGTSLNKEKRHPTLGNRVVVGSGAVILGAITVGDDARVGSGSVVIKPVPAGCTVVGVPGHIVLDGKDAINQLEHAKLTDPIAEVMRMMLAEQEDLRLRMRKLEEHAKVGTNTIRIINNVPLG